MADFGHFGKFLLAILLKKSSKFCFEVRRIAPVPGTLSPPVCEAPELGPPSPFDSLLHERLSRRNFILSDLDIFLANSFFKYLKRVKFSNIFLPVVFALVFLLSSSNLRPNDMIVRCQPKSMGSKMFTEIAKESGNRTSSDKFQSACRTDGFPIFTGSLTCPKGFEHLIVLTDRRTTREQRVLSLQN